jgi:hypothetical protein
MGPIDHGFCKSIYFAGPEGMMLEFSTSEGKSIDAEAWIDPEVVKLAGISTADLERYKAPAPYESKGGKVSQVAYEQSKLKMEFPPENRAVLTMTDEQVTARLSETTPPVQVSR